MRKTPTLSELACVAALVETFRNEGHEAEIVPRLVSDKPDALLRIAGQLVACECIQIPPDYIFHHQHKKYQLSDWKGKPVLSVVHPHEPHQWVAAAIKKKVRLRESYLASTGAKEAWLLIHAPQEAKDFLVDGGQEWVQLAVRHGSKMAAHPFTQVFLWTPLNGIFPVWTRKRDTGTHSELGIEFGHGYPVLCMNRFQIPFETLIATDRRMRETKLTFSQQTPVVIPPLDAEYRRHPPATRPVRYHVVMRTTATDCELEVNFEFLDQVEGSGQFKNVATNLAPATQHWHHALHQFRAPKSLRTQHTIQEY